MPDISLCADYVVRGNKACYRHPSRYKIKSGNWQSWGNFAERYGCLKRNEEADNDICEGGLKNDNFTR